MTNAFAGIEYKRSQQSLKISLEIRSLEISFQFLKINTQNKAFPLFLVLCHHHSSILHRCRWLWIVNKQSARGGKPIVVASMQKMCLGIDWRGGRSSFRCPWKYHRSWLASIARRISTLPLHWASRREHGEDWTNAAAFDWNKASKSRFMATKCNSLLCTKKRWRWWWKWTRRWVSQRRQRTSSL